MKVRDVMSPDVVSVRTDTPVRRLVELMSDQGFSGFPVVSDDGRVIGVVSEADLVVKEARGGDAAAGLSPADRRRKNATCAGELMTTPAVVVDADDDLRAAARLLTKYALKRVPVTRGGRLCGVVSRHDVLRTFLRPDADIRAEVDRILAERVTDTAHDIIVDVRDGVVTLRGTVMRRSTAALIENFVDRIDGVTKIIDGILSAVDDTVHVPVVPPIIPVQERI
jgi:CBS domain-containing protein